MKLAFIVKQALLGMVAVFSLAVGQKAEAIPFVSNLADVYPGGPGAIGPIGTLRPGGTDTARFTTGSGYNYSLNSITLEILTGSGVPAGWSQGWNNLDIQLFQSTGGGNVLLGSLGNPVVDSTPTQWPNSGNPYYTTYIDFSPFGNITLSPLSHYSVVVSVPPANSTGANLLFTLSSAYTTPTDWTMGPTTAGNPNDNGGFLKLAVDATAVPDQSSTASLLIGGVIVLVGFRRFIQAKVFSSCDIVRH